MPPKYLKDLRIVDKHKLDLDVVLNDVRALRSQEVSLEDLSEMLKGSS